MHFKKYVIRLLSSSKWRVTVSGDLMFLESYGNCDVTNTETFGISLRFQINTNSPVVNI